MTQRLRLATGLMLVLSGPATAQDPDSLARAVAPEADFRVYSRAGVPSSLADILAATDGSDVLLVGEEHDDMVGHRVEEALLAGAIDRRMSVGLDAGGVVLSLEMFERDVQYVLDEYLTGLISEEHFLLSSRPWDDYEARYRALVELSKERGVPIVAANAPRRYVNRVTREGPASLGKLSAFARAFLPPLPYPGPSDSYRAQWDATMAEARTAMREPTDTTHSTPEEAGEPHGAPEAERAPEAPGHGRPAVERPEAGERGYQDNPNALWAQALWDAAMGHSIARVLLERAGGLVVHIAGSFHVERGTGIAERIEDYRAGSRVVTVVMTKSDDIEDWRDDEHQGLADFVILTRRPDGTGSRTPRS